MARIQEPYMGTGIAHCSSHRFDQCTPRHAFDRESWYEVRWLHLLSCQQQTAVQVQRRSHEPRCTGDSQALWRKGYQRHPCREGSLLRQEHGQACRFTSTCVTSHLQVRRSMFLWHLAVLAECPSRSKHPRRVERPRNLSTLCVGEHHLQQRVWTQPIPLAAVCVNLLLWPLFTEGQGIYRFSSGPRWSHWPHCLRIHNGSRWEDQHSCQGYQRSRDESYRIHPITEWSQELSGNCRRPHRKWYYLSWSQTDCVGSWANHLTVRYGSETPTGKQEGY